MKLLSKLLRCIIFMHSFFFCFFLFCKYVKKLTLTRVAHCCCQKLYLSHCRACCLVVTFLEHTTQSSEPIMEMNRVSWFSIHIFCPSQRLNKISFSLYKQCLTDIKEPSIGRAVN